MKRKLIGHVGVDSGQIVIVDPCILSQLVQQNAYDLSCEVTTSRHLAGKVCIEFEGKPIEMGVAARAGDGDGTYPVYAEYGLSGLGNWQIIKRIIIEFDPDPEFDPIN